MYERMHLCHWVSLFTFTLRPLRLSLCVSYHNPCPGEQDLLILILLVRYHFTIELDRFIIKLDDLARFCPWLTKPPSLFRQRATSPEAWSHSQFSPNKRIPMQIKDKSYLPVWSVEIENLPALCTINWPLYHTLNVGTVEGIDYQPYCNIESESKVCEGFDAVPLRHNQETK